MTTSTIATGRYIKPFTELKIPDGLQRAFRRVEEENIPKPISMNSSVSLYAEQTRINENMRDRRPRGG